MQQTLDEQTGIFLWSFVLGAVLGVIYTLLAIARAWSPPSPRQWIVGDLLFMAIAAMLNFLFALSQTYGRIRGYVLAAELVTFFLLYGTVGRLLCRSTLRIRSLCEQTVTWMTAPFRRQWHTLRKKLAKKCRKMLRNGKKS